MLTVIASLTFSTWGLISLSDDFFSKLLISISDDSFGISSVPGSVTGDK